LAIGKSEYLCCFAFLQQLTLCDLRHLAPIWVLPEYQGRGVASLLLLDAIEIADQVQPPQPMYLEYMPEARVIYERFGYRLIGEEGKADAMIRNPPAGMEVSEKQQHDGKRVE
jgi:GNAT superfamily N-acetyltransferase